MMTAKKKPSCESVYPDCSKYKTFTKGCPCCGAKIEQWGVFSEAMDEGFTGLRCTECEWECVD